MRLVRFFWKPKDAAVPTLPTWEQVDEPLPPVWYIARRAELVLSAAMPAAPDASRPEVHSFRRETMNAQPHYVEAGAEDLARKYFEYFAKVQATRELAP